MVGRTLMSLLVRLGVDASSYHKDMEEAERRAAKTTKELNRMAQVAGAALLGVSAAGGAFLLSATKLAARVETLGVVVKSLGKIADYTEKELEGFEQQIKSQGITTQNTLQSMAQMIQANIDLAHGADLARIAQNTAVIAGINSSEAFQRLVTILQTGNVLMGRTMGLTLDFAGAQKTLADSLGKTVAELSDAEVMQARLNEVMKAGVPIANVYEDAMGTAGKAVYSLDRLVEEARLTIGDLFLPAFTSVVNAATKVLEGFNALEPVIQNQIAAAIGLGVAFTGITGAALLFVTALPAIQAGLIAIGIASVSAFAPIMVVATALGVLIGAIVLADVKQKTAVKGAEDLTRQLVKEGRSTEYINRRLKWYAEAAGVEIQQTKERTVTSYGMSHSYEYQAGTVALLTDEGRRLIETELGLRDAEEDLVYAMITGRRPVKDMEESWAAYGEQLEGTVETAEEATARYITNAFAIVDASRTMWDSLKPDVAGMVEGWLKIIDFYQAGGLELQTLAQNTWQALRSGAITDTEAEELFAPILVASQLMAEHLEGAKFWDICNILKASGMTQEKAHTAAKEAFADLPAYIAGLVEGTPEALVEAMMPTAGELRGIAMAAREGVVLDDIIPPEIRMTIPETLEAAFAAAGITDEVSSQIQAGIDSVDTTGFAKQISDVFSGPIDDMVTALNEDYETTWTIDIVYTGAPVPKGGLQYGGSGVVPPGFPRDSYPLMLSSGEHFDITPANQVDSSRSMHIENLIVQGGGQGIETQMAMEDSLLRVLEELL